MPWLRHILKEPPPANQIESWEREGWAFVQIVGPCPALEDVAGAKPRMVYVVYLHRSIIEATRNARVN